MGIKKTLAMLSLAAGATMGSMKAEAKVIHPERRSDRIEHRAHHHDAHKVEKAAFVGGLIGGVIAGLTGNQVAAPTKVVKKTVVVKKTITHSWWPFGR